MRVKNPSSRDFQDQLLSRLMETRQITTIYMRNRMSLRGRVLRFDAYVLLLDPLDGTPPQLVYKSAMVSISGPRQMPGPPARPGDRYGERPGPRREYPPREGGEEEHASGEEGGRFGEGPRFGGPRPPMRPRPQEGGRPFEGSRHFSGPRSFERPGEGDAPSAPYEGE